MTQLISIGDTVAYTDTFIDRHGHYHDDIHSAQGMVLALHSLESGVILADIQWNKPGLPPRVSSKVLTRVIERCPD